MMDAKLSSMDNAAIAAFGDASLITPLHLNLVLPNQRPSHSGKRGKLCCGRPALNLSSGSAFRT